MLISVEESILAHPYHVPEPFRTFLFAVVTSMVKGTEYFLSTIVTVTTVFPLAFTVKVLNFVALCMRGTSSLSIGCGILLAITFSS